MATYTATFTRTATGTTPATVSLSSSLSSLPNGVTSTASSASISAIDPIPDSQGTTFAFNGVNFVAKNVKVKRSRPTIDATPLSAAAGSTRVLVASPLADGDVITCEYFGTTAPERGVKATISCSTLGITGNAFCEDFELTAAVGELIMGTATFKLTG